VSDRPDSIENAFSDPVLELRAHARVDTDVGCELRGTLPARVRNLGLGGALLAGPLGLSDVGDIVSLELSHRDGTPLKLQCEVLRIQDRQKHALYGVRFVDVDPEREPQRHQALVRCIESLAEGRGAGARSLTRVHRRMLLQCRGKEPFTATMNDVSLGGLGLSCEAELAVGQKLRVESVDGVPLEVSGVVTHVHRESDGRFRAGVQLGPLDQEQRIRLYQFVRRVIEQGTGT
jgi:hypothetical protein